MSDAHLGAPSSVCKNRETKITAFLNSIRDSCCSLFLVGDIFDFWFEYRHVIPKDYHQVLFALRQLTDRNIPVHYIAGNHDFWIGNFLSRAIGINVHFKPLDIVIHGKKFLILHGDGVAPFDWGYRLMKKILRFPLNIHLYRLLHPDLGIWLAKSASNLSRFFTRERSRKKNIPEIYRKEAQKILERGYEFVVMAHTHSPEIVKCKEKTYANCGDWIETFSYLTYYNGAIELKIWDR
ncbi:MAG: UDP-2,3-diacylglucosamine diphosphatase [bacterium]